MTRTLDPDERAALEDQRDFLLASLDDLEREHDAGDIDEHDYTELRDDYTSRAARVIRTIEAHQVEAHQDGGEPRRPSRRTLAVGAGVAAFVLVAGVLVAQASGRRGAGDNATGDIRQSASELLDQANALAADRQLEEAIAAYDQVLEIEPDNVVALTYKGWMQIQSGDQHGVVTLVDAAQADPSFPDVHFFLAWAFAQLGRPETALQELDRLQQLNPPPELAQPAADLRAQIEGATTTTTTAVPGG